MKWLAVWLVTLGAALFAIAFTDSPRTIFFDSSTAGGSADRAPTFNASALRFWKQTGLSKMPAEYYQGATSDRSGDLYFDGPFSGLYRTDLRLHETARNEHVIPPSVRSTEGYNHIGDISWDPREGGRLLLPLGCFYPKLGRRSNTCKTMSVGVADPRTLSWRYYVRLSPRYVNEAIWNEIAPDGKLLWTSAGRDLLGYRVSEINPTNAGPGGRQLTPARRLTGVKPPIGITGAAFYGGRLFLAGHHGGNGVFQIWSVELARGTSVLEAQLKLIGESEGLDFINALGGVLHWQIQPYNREHKRPTYGYGHATFLHFVPRAGPSRPAG